MKWRPMIPMIVLAMAAEVHAGQGIQLPAGDNHVVVRSSTSSGGESNASATMSGQGGRIQINGDEIEVKEGALTVNQRSYGRVDKASTIQYTVVNGVKSLKVDGVVRTPLEL